MWDELLMVGVGVRGVQPHFPILKIDHVIDLLAKEAGAIYSLENSFTICRRKEIWSCRAIKEFGKLKIHSI